MTMEKKFDLASQSDFEEQIARLQRRVEREVRARKSAERLLEEKSLELYKSNRKLARLNENLEKTVERRTNTLASLIKNLHTAILLEDENRRVLLANEKLCEYFDLNLKPADLTGEDFTDTDIFVNKFLGVQGEVQARIDELYANKQLDTKDVLHMKNGRVVKRDFIPIYARDEYLGQLWKFQDITRQYYHEEEIKRSEEKYRGIIENMELGLLEVDLNHNILKAYDWFCDLTGYTKEELIGKNAKKLFLSEDYNQLMDEQDKHRKEGKQSIYEVQMKRKDGKLIWVLISGAPFYDANGKVVGSIGIHYNITDRKQLETELREARVIAENAREAEKQFLANMSHEIRNPINAIAGLTNLLYDTKLNTEQQDLLNNIKYAADILLGLITDVLDISKIEAGEMELNEREVELSELLNAVIQTSQFKTTNSRLKFKWSIDDRLKEPLLADPTVVNQIFLNLIGNSIKFTDEGEIKVKAELVEETSEEVTVKCAVTDTGIGMSEDQLEFIFEKFKQANKQTKLKYGGTGLGLSIVKQLVKMYRGEISAISREGKGTSFVFTMIFRKPRNDWNKKELRKPKTSSDVETLGQILVVEDNKINQQYLTGLLKRWELTYDVANNGQEALEFIDKKTYELVLMDIRMPVMDGYETTIRIRSLAHNDNQHIPIVALTASALVDEKKKALAAGMNYHLTKPFSPDQLLSILYEINAGKSNLMNIDLQAYEEGHPFAFTEKLDKEYLNTFYGDDLERANIMFGIFLRTIQDEYAKLQDFYASKDLKGIRETAHRIKPNFAMVGLTAETDLLNNVEQAADAEDLEGITPLLTSFFENYAENIALVESEQTRIAANLSF